ncbi:hypothetical protein Pan153_46760 [Gimesia panareensis]|uniref:Uncharacterized protein n=1 Tax=Gimesia panareensis TaxID=2527978 RepID=A0A518FUI3_9PLAN|nr:hypothetical protein [Gimesia panareensis]QDV20007.1 hypothetical protein Pan153_46760 [Gimesia panareensis]
MADADLTSSELKEQFKAAVTRYDLQVLMRGAIACVSFLMMMALLACVVKYFQAEIHHGLGMKSGTEDCPEAVSPILLIPIVLLSVCFPALFLYRQVKRLRQSTAPHCPFCHVSLGQHASRTGAMATGFCPACQQKMFEGELDSGAVAVEKYEKAKSEFRRYIRFTFSASMGALLIVLPVYLWLYFTNQLPGKNPPTLAEILILFPLLFSLVPLGLWWVGKLSVRDQQNIRDLFRAGEQKYGIIEARRSEQESQQ